MGWKRGRKGGEWIRAENVPSGKAGEREAGVARVSHVVDGRVLSWMVVASG